MKEKEKMLAGKLYIDSDPELVELRNKAKRLVREFNDLPSDLEEKRQQIIRELFGSCKGNFHIEPSIRCDYGINIEIGEDFFANYDCVFLDVNKITFGDRVFIAPRCCFFTAGHPIDCDVRNKKLEYGWPIKVGNDVWIGGSVVVNPGVTIGDNVVIGSGSVVTKDIPSGVVAAGNPCRVIRKITEDDKMKWRSLEETYYREK